MKPSVESILNTPFISGREGYGNRWSVVETNFNENRDCIQ